MQNMSEPGHPLFLPEEDDDEPVQVSQIQVTRMENGKQVFAPRVRPASELQSLEQIAGEFGGGTYVLIARHEGRITTRRKYDIPGLPKPLYDEEPKTAPTPVASQTAPIDPMSAMMGGQQGGSLMGLIMMMMQQMMQQQAAAAQSQTQMFIAMMNNNQQSSAEEKAQARAELQANIERERLNSERTMALMREMMGNRGGSSEDFTRGVEFMRTFAQQQIEMAKSAAKGEDNGGELASLLETLGMAMQGFGMLKSVTGGGAMPEGVAQVAEVAQ